MTSLFTNLPMLTALIHYVGSLLQSYRKVCLSLMAVFLTVSLMGGFAAPVYSQTQNAGITKTVSLTQAQRNMQARGDAMLDRLMRRNGIPSSTVKSFRIVDEDELNAGTNGEVIIFTDALWQRLGDDDRRAFVLGHELAHITLNHVRNTTIRRVGLLGLGAFLSNRFGGDNTLSSRLIRAASQAGVVLTEAKFSRRQEYAADERGVEYMADAGYDPNGALEAFRILQQADNSGTPEFLRSHPMSQNRLEAIVRNQKRKGLYFNPVYYPSYNTYAQRDYELVYPGNI